MRKYAVFGMPVRHSLSPWLHAHFARALQRNIAYAAYAPPPEQFAAAVRAFFAGGGRGINITAPYKKDALGLAARASSFARRAAAANVLTAEDGELSAHNTDGAGLIRDITQNLGVELSGKKILIAGAGGAARAAALALAGLDCQITVAARRLDAAQELAKMVNGGAAALSDCGGGYAAVINAIPGGAGVLPPETFRGAELGYDINYGAAADNFLRAASAAKLRADGGGMLAEQAALSFALWEGAMPPVKPLVNYLRARERKY